MHFNSKFTEHHNCSLADKRFRIHKYSIHIKKNSFYHLKSFSISDILALSSGFFFFVISAMKCHFCCIFQYLNFIESLKKIGTGSKNSMVFKKKNIRFQSIFSCDLGQFRRFPLEHTGQTGITKNCFCFSSKVGIDLCFHCSEKLKQKPDGHVQWQ